jgi:hypothetical protein
VFAAEKRRVVPSSQQLPLDHVLWQLHRHTDALRVICEFGNLRYQSQLRVGHDGRVCGYTCGLRDIHDTNHLQRQ